jgi:Cu/Ag efflux pump CusA
VPVGSLPLPIIAAGIALIPLVLAPGEPGKEILHPVAVASVGLVVTPAFLCLIGRKAASGSACAVRRNKEPGPYCPSFSSGMKRRQ